MGGPTPQEGGWGEGAMAGNVQTSSFVWRMLSGAWGVVQGIDPLWLLPEWLKTMVVYSLSCALFMGSGVAALLYFNQNRMLYHPQLPNLPRDQRENPENYRDPGEWGMPYEDVEVVAADDTRLHCWMIKAERSSERPTIIFFQENAGNMGFRLPPMNALWKHLGVNLFMVSYRGYGRSEGTPTEAGIKLDAEAVLQHVAQRKDVDRTRIVLLGKSLGGAVAVYVADKLPQHVKGIILENTFTSIPDMVDVVLPLVAPMKSLVLRIDWSTISAIPRITAPILFVSGLLDELVPPTHMRALYDAATKSLSRTFHAVPNGMHNDTSMRDPTYIATLKAWMEKIGCGDDSPPSPKGA